MFNAKIEYNKNNAFSNPLASECARNNVNSILSFVYAKKNERERKIEKQQQQTYIFRFT